MVGKEGRKGYTQAGTGKGKAGGDWRKRVSAGMSGISDIANCESVVFLTSLTVVSMTPLFTDKDR